MALGVHISNQLQPVLLFSCFRYNYHQFSLTVTKSSIITSYAFQFIRELLFNYCLLQYYYVVEQIFSATFTRVYQINGIKGLPYPCVHFTFIYRINEQSLAVNNQTLLPHPWHPLNGVVLNRTVRFWYSRQTHLVYPVWYYSHSIDVNISAFILALDTRNTTYSYLILLYRFGARFFQHHAPYHVCNSVHLLGLYIVSSRVTFAYDQYHFI